MDVNEFFAEETPKQPNPRRRKRDPRKELLRTYGPLALVAVLLILFIIFAVGSVKRSNAKREAARQESLAAQESSIAEQAAWDAEAEDILSKATAMAAGYDYDGAIALIDGFSGELYLYDELLNLLDACNEGKKHLIPWNDPNEIVNLSFNLLIADPDRAFANEKYGESFYKNFITVSEFTNILTQLYENDYVLVDLDDFLEVTTTESGVEAFSYKPLLLPEGKKPFINMKVEHERYAVQKEALHIKAGDSADSILSLSGGNQQKVFLGRCLNIGADVLLFDNPTQGVDVGAKEEIYRLILGFAEAGKTVIINTLEIPEIQKVADRCVVFYEGEIIKIFEHSEVNEQDVMLYSTNAIETIEEAAK